MGRYAKLCGIHLTLAKTKNQRSTRRSNIYPFSNQRLIPKRRRNAVKKGRNEIAAWGWILHGNEPEITFHWLPSRFRGSGNPVAQGQRGHQYRLLFACKPPVKN